MEPIEMCATKYKLQRDIKVELEAKREGVLITYLSLFVRSLCEDMLHGSEHNKFGKSKIP